ncbi:Com family DNA-binding transcriptional regulator [Pseudomonas sp. FP198]|nr:Com family DNA-binding transcriptional regulator [Pseudomonas sp. FP198]WLG93838.1 Com family DNA-binding transcriptional regulator [Pseudomonas sp. FP198]
MGEYTQLQIKCSRCGILNHVRATSPERSPLSDMNAEPSAKSFDPKGEKMEPVVIGSKFFSGAVRANYQPVVTPEQNTAEW